MHLIQPWLVHIIAYQLSPRVLYTTDNCFTISGHLFAIMNSMQTKLAMELHTHVEVHIPLLGLLFKCDALATYIVLESRGKSHISLRGKGTV